MPLTHQKSPAVTGWEASSGALVSRLRGPAAQSGAPLPSAGELGVHVRVTRGVDRGRHVLIALAPRSVGTAADNDLVLRDMCVSRHHCELAWRDGQLLVRDLGSTNGTYVDEVRVVESVVAETSTVRIGDTTLELVADVAPRAAETFGELVGCSEAARQLFASLRSVAHSALTCLLLGETGTGKELLARALHEQSPRRDHAFVVVDCASIGPQFIEDKLFGHHRGAFTGAHEAQPGVFESAKGGTVFLDEIGELPSALQPKLLGVLERREATRIGSHTPVKLDVRVIAATHRNLPEMVSRGDFRQDLLYRLCEFTARVAPLRERPEDIAPIAYAILAREGYTHRLSDDALSYLAAQRWPGNVRELRNTLRRAAVLSAGTTIDSGLLVELEQTTSVSLDLGRSEAPRVSITAGGDPLLFGLSLDQATEAFRCQYVRDLRQRFGNDLQAAARHAGIHPKSVSRLFRLYCVT